MLAKVITLKPGAPSKGFGNVMRYVMRANEELPPGQTLDGGHFNIPEERLYWSLDEHRLAYAEDLAATCDSTAERCFSKGRFQGNPVYHVAITWQEGEHPTSRQAEHACKHVMNALGYGEHQAAWAIHRDTDNDHVHLVINRVHPEKFIAVQPPFKKDYFILDRCMRELELEFGYARANGPYITLDTDQGPTIVRMSRAERRMRGLLKEEGPRISERARRAEKNLGGAASFQEWAAGGPAKAIKAVIDTSGATWERVHQQAARYGLTIQPKGSGMIVATTMDDGRTLAAKASQMGRWASKAALEKRLGPFQPPQGPLPAAGFTYQKALDADKAYANGQGVRRGVESDERTARRQERAAARKALAARFKAEQDAARRDRPAQRAALTQQHRAQRQELTVQMRQERKALREQARQQGQPLAVVQSLWALRAAQEREALQKRQAAERKALSAKLPRQEVWRTWLEREAAQGDEAAQAALRGIRYREQRQKNKAVDGIEGEELDPLRKLTLAGLQAQIDQKRQLVLYRGTDGREKFTDTGPRIVMHDKSGESLEAALRMAAQKFGGKVDITGSAEFRERAARQAVRLGIEVTDADLQHVVADERARMQNQARGLSPSAVEKSRPEVAKPLQPQAGTGLPQKEAADPAVQAMERALDEWIDGDHSAGPVKAFIAAHDRALQQGREGRELVALAVGRVLSRRGDDAGPAIAQFNDAVGRQIEREIGR